jgi:hypothetical protein
MTRPKSVRGAEKKVFANSTPLRKTWVPFLPTYAAAIQVLWEPHVSPGATLAYCDEQLQIEMSLLYLQALQYFGLLGGEE